MALIGSDSERGAPRAPISGHRAFPAIVALWFAVLLGLGSLVLPVVLLERGVAMTGIAALVPAASPPLGMTARGLIALAAAIVGALAGLAIARRVARAQDSGSATPAVTFASGARRPIDVNAELGGEGLASGFGQPVTRRRALAIAQDDRPSDAFYAAPLPGTDEHEPLPYGELAFAPEPIETPFEPCDPVEAATEAWDRAEPAASGAPVDFQQDFEPLPPEPVIEPSRAFAPDTREAEPLPFAAPSLVRRATPEPDEPFQAAPASPAGEPELVQLVQRLRSSLERRREGIATEPAPTQAEPAGFEPAPADDAAHATAAYFAKPAGSVLPAVDFADGELDEDEHDEGEEADGAYSSLLAMRGPYTPGASTRVHIEIDEPEAVEEEGVEPGEPADTDAALRAALTKLQRVGGGA